MRARIGLFLGLILGLVACDGHALTSAREGASLSTSSTLSVYIDGPLALSLHESAQFTAVTSGGAPGYTYEWRSRDYSPNWGWGAWQSWYSTGSDNWTYSSVNACGITRKELEVRVTDAWGYTAGDTHIYDIKNPC